MTMRQLMNRCRGLEVMADLMDDKEREEWIAAGMPATDEEISFWE